MIPSPGIEDMLLLVERQRAHSLVQSPRIENKLLQHERQRARGTVLSLGIEDMLLQQDWRELTQLRGSHAVSRKRSGSSLSSWGESGLLPGSRSHQS